MTGDLIEIYVQYRADVTVMNQKGVPLNGVTVFGNDTNSIVNHFNPTSNFSDVTNSTGQTNTQILTEFLANSTNELGNYVYFTNYTINATLAGYNPASTVINLTESKSITLTLDQQNVCNENTGICYATIQRAINAANDYDRIAIINDAKDYNESVVVNVTGLTLFANTSTFPVVFSDSPDLTPVNATINISASNVTVSNLTVVYNGSAIRTSGIGTRSFENITIINNTVNNTGSGSYGYGIYLFLSNFSLVENNTINTAGGSNNYGIWSNSSDSSNVTSNTITTDGSSDNWGIYVSGSSNNTVSDNIVSTNGIANNNIGMYIAFSITSNIIQQNTITTNGTSGNGGMLFTFSSENHTIQQNIITTDGTSFNNGIVLSGANNNIFIDSNVSTGGTGSGNEGIYLNNADNNIFRVFNVTTNGTDSDDGIQLEGSSSNNTFYDGTISAGGLGRDDDVRLLGSDINYFVNVSYNKTSISSSGATGQFYNQYRLDVTIQDQDSNPINGALVWGNDTDSVVNTQNPTSNFSDTTNSTGQINTQILTEFVANNTNQYGNYVYFTNYTINASLAGYSDDSAIVNLTESKNITLVLTSISDNVCNLNTDTCYVTIQEAINNANDYDRVAIINDAKDYNESVVVNVTGLMLTSNTSTFPVVFSDFNHTIYVSADNVTVRNLTIVHNSTAISFLYGLYVDTRLNITLINNTINNTGSGNLGYGVYFDATNSSVVENNMVHTAGGSSNYGIRLVTSSNSTLSNNTITTSGTSGIVYGVIYQGNIESGIYVEAI